MTAPALRALSTFLALAAPAIAGSISSCGGAGDRLQNVHVGVSPDPIKKGGPFTITLTGTLDEQLEAGLVDAHLDVKLLGLIDEKVRKNVSFTIAPGIPGGQASISVGPVVLPPKLPGSAEVDGQVRLLDTSSKQVACLLFNLHVPAMNDVVDNSKEGESDVSTAMRQFTNCGKPSDHLQNISATAAGGVTTFEAVLDEDLTKVVVDVDLVLSALFVHIPLKLSVPVTYTPGVKKGALKATVTDFDDAPVERVAAKKLPFRTTGTVSVADGAGQEVACLKVASVPLRESSSIVV
eukprot:TRINITY_DN11895_c0_g1_i1.p1 TRINITY_DN11895_c0_g1~~TRINITY_DN11895_c0_g1_i1.p1  ORF type:complete len:311 (+),score=65.83 TRINITY_DN11895_c0_g1_i1:54-935(+)